MTLVIEKDTKLNKEDWVNNFTIVAQLLFDLGNKIGTDKLGAVEGVATLNAAQKVLQTALNAEKWNGYSYDSKVGQANGIATLDSNGKLPASQLPAISLTSIVTVDDEEARLALTDVQGGDAAKQLDTGITYILKTGGNPAVDSDWVAIGDTIIVISDVQGLQEELDNKQQSINPVTGWNSNVGIVNRAGLVVTDFNEGGAKTLADLAAYVNALITDLKMLGILND